MEEKEKKKSNGKLIIAIVLIAATIIIAGLYLGIFSMPTGLAVGKTNSATNGNPTTPQYNVTGNEIISKDITEKLPYYEFVNLEPGRYNIGLNSDVPVLVFVYDEEHFNMWKAGSHSFTLAGTACCKDENKIQSLNQNFNVPAGQGGNVYIVVEGAEQASIKFGITQVLKW
jgi:hypothetical protein